MLSFNLWNALQHPQSIPRYWRLTHRSEREKRLAEQIEAGLGCVLAFPVLILSGLLGLMGYSLFVNAIAAQQTISIADNLAGLMNAGRYNMLAATPLGALRFHWLFAGVFTKRNHIIRITSFNPVILIGVSINAVVTFMFIHAPLAERQFGPALVVMLYLMIFVAVYALALYIEWVQTLALASVIGMLLPTYTTDSTTIRAAGAGVFLGVQLIAYSAVFLMITGVSRRFFAYQPILSILTLTIGLAVFYVVREFMTARLWRLLQQRVNATPTDAADLLQPDHWNRNPRSW
jgi:hypothetical protein